MSKAKWVNSEISDFKVLKVMFPTGGKGNKVSEGKESVVGAARRACVDGREVAEGWCG
jgi:hypothetical protein